MVESTGSFIQPNRPWVEQYARYLALVERSEKAWFLQMLGDTEFYGVIRREENHSRATADMNGAAARIDPGTD